MRRLSWSKTALLSSLKSDASVSERAADYDIALQIVKDHPFTGTGFETFRNLYPAYRKAADPNELYKKVPTMVHNGYLQVLQSTGFPGLCLYLVFIFIILRRLIISLGKNDRPYNDNLLTAALLASIIGYLVQDFSGWPEIALTPLFWIISSLAMNIAGTGADDQDISRKYRNTTVGFAVVVLLFSVWLTGDAVVRWKADAAFCQAGAMDADREWTLQEYYLLKAAELMPNEVLYADQLGIRYYRRYAASGDIGNYKKSLRLFETTLAANPFATEVLLHSLELDGIAFSRQHITEPSALTKHALKNLPLMDRNNADVYEAMAKLELGRKSFSQSELYIDNALRIDGSKPSALVLAGEICREQKKFPEAVSYYKRVKGSQLFVHARLAAASALFAQKKYDETIEEANDLLLLYPLEVRAILIRGDAFAALGNMEKAVASYREAIWIDPANPFAIRALEQIGHNRKKD
jgi:tetratricopeptide (TPR) repeat protein